MAKKVSGSATWGSSTARVTHVGSERSARQSSSSVKARLPSVVTWTRHMAMVRNRFGIPFWGG